MHRTCHCMRRPIDSKKGVEVWAAVERKTARFGNVQTCGSVWACPVCAARVSEHRRKELTAAVKAARARGWRVVMLTRTVSHYAFESAAEVVRVLIGQGKEFRGAMARASSGRPAERFREKYGVVGTVRDLEMTWGRNGYHPHIHELLFLEKSYDLDELRRDAAEIWGAAVEAAGGRPLHNQHGLDAADCDARIVAYISKWGREESWTVAHEMAKAVTKKGSRAGQFTMTELLSQFTFEGNSYAGARWREYVEAMHGKHQLQYSRALKKMLGVIDLTDEEISAQKLDGGSLLATIPLEEWRVICRKNEQGRLLAVAATGDVLAFHELLNEITEGATVEELVTQEWIAHGWAVEAKVKRSALDAAICWRVDQRIEAARDDASLGLTPEQGQELRARARKILQAQGGTLEDGLRWIDRVNRVLSDAAPARRGPQDTAARTRRREKR